MGFLDNLKDKAEDFGDKAKEGLEAAREKGSDLVGDVKDRFDGDDENPAAESAEPGIDYSPAAVDEAAAGGISEAAAGAGAVDATQSPVDSIGDVPEPDLGEGLPPTVGEVPEAGLGDLPEPPVEGLPSVDNGTGELGDNRDEFGPA
jgi:hypothetical protein